MSKNLRISFYILLPLSFWMISGLFVEEKIIEEDKISSFATVAVIKSNSEFYKPEILLK